VRPGWVETLDDYTVWLEQVLETCTGHLEEPYLPVERILEDANDEDSRCVLLLVDRHRWRFYDGSYLSCEYSIDEDLEPVRYSFHYARWNDEVVWRYDKHHGHEREDGTDVHVHRGPDERREALDRPTDLDEVLQLINEDQERRSA
jgi:hypothetical protein